jgi:putative methionine-R-sulfoxide reductase with GAF domain
MYDPLIVDTFVQVHEQIAPDSLPESIHKSSIEGIRRGFQDHVPQAGTPQLDQIAASSDEMLTLYALARSLSGQVNREDAADIVAQHLRRLIPSSLCVFFFYDAKVDDLEAAMVFGDAASLIKGLRIPLGQRLSGWVAANKQTIVNSDPTLDLGDIARAVSPRLRSCLSTPLIANDRLAGTLTLYSAVLDGFAEDHRRIIETVAKQASHAFARPRSRRPEIPPRSHHRARALRNWTTATSIPGNPGRETGLACSSGCGRRTNQLRVPGVTWATTCSIMSLVGSRTAFQRLPTVSLRRR